MEEISLKDLFYIALKRKWLILAVLSIFTAAGVVYTFFITDEIYEASATIIVSSQKNTQELNALTYNDYNLNVKLTESYRTLCKTERVLSQVINNADLKLTTGQLEKKISVTAVNNTEILNISVEDVNPKTAEKIANTLADIFQKEVMSIMKMDNVQIIDYAVLPDEPVKPNKRLNILISILLGLLAGTGLAFLIETFDTTIKDIEQVEKVLDIPVLGWIPQIEQAKIKKGAQQKTSFSNRLMKYTVTAGYVRDAFNKIKVNIDFACVDIDNKAFIITSGVAEEGKTTVSVNTAISMASGGYRTLLIDTDMHQPLLHKLLGIPNIQGLSSIIAHKLDWREQINNVDIPNLHVITSGRKPPNPAELLGSNRMKEFIEEVKKEYDYIIFDTPPVMPVPDVASLSKNINTIIIVSKFGFSNINTLKQVKNTMKIAKTNIIGSIITCVPKKGIKYGYGYGYGYGKGYGYGYGFNKQGRMLNKAEKTDDENIEQFDFLREIKIMDRK